jgi:hypothetical protein
LRTRKDGITHDILKKELYAIYRQCPGVQQIRAGERCEKRLREFYRETVVVSDGAAWIRNMCGEIFPDAVQILDFYHLAENINSFSKYLHRQKPQ